MNIPILNRFSEMFGASKQSRYDNDKLASYMFSFLKEGDTYEDLNLSVDVRDAIEECQTYVYRDRPLQINALIEAELENDNELVDDHTVGIHIQDTATLINLIKIRNHIFQ